MAIVTGEVHLEGLLQNFFSPLMFHGLKSEADGADVGVQAGPFAVELLMHQVDEAGSNEAKKDHADGGKRDAGETATARNTGETRGE
jgi:hypothetical protein